MNKSIAAHRFFTQETQRAFYERVQGYVSQEEMFADRYERIRQQAGFGDLVRLDLGQNRLGCAPEVQEYWRNLASQGPSLDYLSAYPEIQGRELQGALARLHGIRPEWIHFSAGLEQAIAQIAATFLENRDRFLVTNPGFFLFDEESRRRGGIPLVLHLEEEGGFAWTANTDLQYEQVLRRLQPKLLWLANPNNPTGRLMPPETIERVVALAAENFCFVVVDEAYAEFTDPDGAVSSASSLLGRYRNLIVLRGFSKAYGLAGIRLGYAMVNHPEIAVALRMHRPNYPNSRLSFELAECALRHIDYLTTVRSSVAEQREWLRGELTKNRRVDWLESETSLGLLRVQGWTGEVLLNRLEKRGILGSPVCGEGVAAQHYVRINQGTPAENRRFAEVMRSLVD